MIAEQKSGAQVMVRTNLMMTKDRNRFFQISFSHGCGKSQCKENAQLEAKIAARLEMIRQGKEATDNG